MAGSGFDVLYKYLKLNVYKNNDPNIFYSYNNAIYNIGNLISSLYFIKSNVTVLTGMINLSGIINLLEIINLTGMLDLTRMMNLTGMANLTEIINLTVITRK